MRDGSLIYVELGVRFVLAAFMFARAGRLTLRLNLRVRSLQALLILCVALLQQRVGLIKLLLQHGCIA
jgi:hypothetical protein